MSGFGNFVRSFAAVIGIVVAAVAGLAFYLNLEIRVSASENQIIILQDVEVAELKNRLEDLDNRLSDIELAIDGADGSDPRTNVLAQRISDLREELETFQSLKTSSVLSAEEFATTLVGINDRFDLLERGASGTSLSSVGASNFEANAMPFISLGQVANVLGDKITFQGCEVRGTIVECFGAYERISSAAHICLSKAVLGDESGAEYRAQKYELSGATGGQTGVCHTALQTGKTNFSVQFRNIVRGKSYDFDLTVQNVPSKRYEALHFQRITIPQ